MASEPRVTRFKINWEETSTQEGTISVEANIVNGTSNGMLETDGNMSADVPVLNENSNSLATMECS